MNTLAGLLLIVATLSLSTALLGCTPEKQKKQDSDTTTQPNGGAQSDGSAKAGDVDEDDVIRDDDVKAKPVRTERAANEAEAKRMLDSARALIEAKKNVTAMVMLNEVIDQHPQTNAADEARKILKELEDDTSLQ